MNQYAFIGIVVGLVWFALIVAAAVWAGRSEDGHPV